MQLLFKLTALAAFTTAASAAAITLDSRTTKASALLGSYTLPSCTKTNGAGGVVATKNTVVNENNCTAIPTTLSFEPHLITPCPAGLNPVLTVFSKAGCSGTEVVARGFTSSNENCMNDAANGKSALLTCASA